MTKERFQQQMEALDRMKEELLNDKEKTLQFLKDAGILDIIERSKRYEEELQQQSSITQQQ